MKKIQTPRGTRDFLPEEMIKREFVINKIKQVFEKYGFDPLQTPAFESWSLLSAKQGGGEEIKEDIYYFKDKAGRELGLRFDLTVPLARVIANNPQLTKPFRRYAIGRVWRYDRPQKGRYREFWQADVDSVGSKEMISDAEFIAIDVDAFRSLGFKNFVVRINNRKVIEGLLEICNIDKNKYDIFRILDKLEKIGLEEVKKELNKLGVDSKKIIDFISIRGKPDKTIEKAKKILKDSKIGTEGLNELEEVIKYCKMYDIIDYVEIDFSIARGLNYYTGIVYETNIKGFEGIGSVCSGGRYDKLVEIAGGESVPGVGLSFGIERIVDIMKEKNMFDSIKTKTKVFIVSVNNSVRKDCIKLVQELRKNGINAQIDIMGRNIRKQLEYVDSLGIPYAIIVGPEEVKKNKYKLKDMKKGTEQELSQQNILNKLK
ncbi:MAG: histidine--tRNA ligase [Candidatus Aenigmarchaeota archaeon]|nr:histidine--tRNA ligase [Candidatus Aenigmarchaeota archaeon]